MTARDERTGEEAAAAGTGYQFSGLHHIQLAIPPGGEDLARRYYGEILGMTELEKPLVLAARDGCRSQADGLELHLGVELELHLGVEKDFRPAAKAHPESWSIISAPWRSGWNPAAATWSGVGSALPWPPALLLPRPALQPSGTA